MSTSDHNGTPRDVTAHLRIVSTIQVGCHKFSEVGRIVLPETELTVVTLSHLTSNGSSVSQVEESIENRRITL